MRQVAQGEDCGFAVGGNRIHELRYADDTTLLETAIGLMQRLVDKIKDESEKVGLYLNKDKTKLMAIGDQTQDTVTVDGTEVERTRSLSWIVHNSRGRVQERNRPQNRNWSLGCWKAAGNMAR
eukprot:gene16784-biopygen5923